MPGITLVILLLKLYSHRMPTLLGLRFRFVFAEESLVDVYTQHQGL